MVNEALTAAGWQIIRIWEHEDRAIAADRVSEALATHALQPRVRPPLI